ncbi:TRAP transporter large permease subunit [Cobetia marina]|jgi:tripartite ATP-independent transporter DctM subunit|uniref:TRAP transporter large permease protein n=1 Tax=Cobetia marina TaxID=28258 RepID=A0ABU9GBJ8_COBMA|nr:MULTISPECIES: TRAP transporter large permease subunit [Cobetia]AOM01014.1 L-dehydroascorbate transporter large permease subunit [Cobetia marina]AZV31011.1 L-dehydroascorbate transporter large permease subunit [Cobetia sp. ICG0124]MDA5565321.1 TRAP transporter large permease subunit [Cobetia sp. MMG027]MDH2292344.1 TRAP transporter large permease subunit [Cobetia sp. 10Alg 146]MDH2373855.1 TRAP transporter large permease subunit [Cobetia sp. 3AK]
MTIGLFLGSLLAAIGLSLPIAFALLVSAIVLMLHLDLFNSQILAQNLVNGADSYTLLAIPFFLTAGEVMSRGGLSQRIVTLAMSLVGHRKGGLGFVAIFAAIVMASLSGSAVADTAALASMLLPMMRKAGYPLGRSSGLMAAGGIIAPIIPPSIPLIIIGVAGGISIGKLFLAGIVPGLIMGVTLVVMWLFMTRKEDLVVTKKASGRERLKALKDSFWAIMLPVIIIGGIKSGIFTPTEAGVVAAVYAIFVATVVYRELDLSQLYAVLAQAARSTAIVMFLVAAAMVASWLISIAQLPLMVAGLLQPLADDPRILMLAIMGIVLVVGMVMDLTPTILVLTPILMPIVKLAGIDPVYFGIMFVLNCAIGLITPPVGNVLNVITSVGNLKFEKAVSGVAPFALAYVVILLLFVAFPQIITVPLYWMTD